MASETSTRVHGTVVSIAGKGVLLRGSSGAGKSDLALRLIDEGAQLVSDDQVNLNNNGGQIVASAPETIRGKMEVRGVGIVELNALALCPVCLVVDLARTTEMERLPVARKETLLGVEIAAISLDPFEPSAAAKLRIALRSIGI